MTIVNPKVPLTQKRQKMDLVDYNPRGLNFALRLYC